MNMLRMLPRYELFCFTEYGSGANPFEPEDQGAVPYTPPLSFPLYGGPVVTIHASLDDITSESKGRVCACAFAFAWLEKFRATSRPLTTRPWFDTLDAKARGKISLSVSKPGLTSRQEELDLVAVFTPNSNAFTPYPLKPGIKRAVCRFG